MIRIIRIILALVLVSWPLRGQVPELLYLKFNEGSGVATVDDSLVGMPGVSPIMSATSFPWNAGILGSFSLNQYLAGPTCSMQAPLSVTGDWTIEFWYRQSSSASSSGKSVFSDISAGGLDLKVAGNATVDPSDLRLLGAFGELVIEDVAVSNTWVHVAIVNDVSEGTMTPFVNAQAGMPWLPAGPTDLVGALPGVLRFPGAATGQVDEFRIWDRVLSRAEILTGMNTELSAATTDLLVSAVTKPVFVPHSTEVFGAAEAVSCEIKNVGTATIAAGTVFSVSFSVGGGTPLAENLTLAQSLAPGASLAYTFTATADLSLLGPRSITVSVQLVGDQNPGNDARSREFGGDEGFLINVFPWTEDFEDFPGYAAGGWFERMSRWSQENEPGGTGVSDSWAYYENITGNLGDVSVGGRATSSSPNYVALRSPLLDFRGLSSPRLRFNLLSDLTLGSFAYQSVFSIDIVSQPGDVIITDVYGPVGDMGPGWKSEQVDLSAFAGQTVNVRLRIVAPPVAGQSGNFVYVDDLLVTDHPLGNGQAPQPGLAVFDLNNAMNVGMNSPSYGESGPYFVAASPGDSLIFSFEGGPAQPILLIGGPLNPVAATFPNIGQLDIGGPVDPLSGIPIGISIIFDGNQPGGLNGLFVTGPTGLSSFGLAMPPLPPGVLSTFQAVLRDPSTGLFVIGNAIEFTVN